jgi:hypothetical protein
MIHSTSFSRKISNIIDFLNERKKLTFSLMFLYSFLIIKLHDPLVNVSVFVMKRMSIQGYNTFISILALTSLLCLIAVLIAQLKKHQNQLQLKLILLFSIISILLIHYVYLLEMNIEIIHAFAYGGLVVLFFAFFKRWAAAVIFSIPVMLLDEWNQYINLYPTYVEYWELNDVLLNMLGQIFVLCFLFSLNIFPNKHNYVWFKKPELFMLVFLVLSFTLFTVLGLFSTHQNYVTETTIFNMSKLQNHTVSWHIHGLTKKVYYILTPKESLFLFTVICSLLIVLDEYLLRKINNFKNNR